MLTADDLPMATAAIGPARGHRVERLGSPDIPRQRLDLSLDQLQDRADDALAAQARLQGLLRANPVVASDLCLSVTLRHIVEAARDLLNARYAAIAVLGGDTQALQVVHTGMSEDLAARISQLPGGHLVCDPSTAGVDPDLSDPATGSGGRAPVDPTNVDFLGVPIRIGIEVLGNLYLGAHQGSPWTAEDEQLVTALAVTAGVAITSSRLLAESEHRNRWLAASGLLTNQLLAAETGERLLCVTRVAMTAADADFATLTVPYGDDQVMVAAAIGDAVAALVNRISATAGSRAGRTIRTGRPALITEHTGDWETHHADDLTSGQVMIVPLAAGAHTRGAVTIGRDAGRDGFCRADLDMAMSFGAQAAAALGIAEARDTQISDARVDDHDRIAFDMHDHVMGELFALGMGLQGLAAVTDNPTHAERLNTYVDTLDQVIGKIRTTIFQLQPHRHDPAGLQTHILGIAEAHAEQLGFHPHLHFTGPIDRVVDKPLVADILAVTREALSNCARHAGASEVSVSVAIDHDLLTLEITDNGHGIGTPSRSSGLRNMRRRAENHSGSLGITEPPTGGTRLKWSVICTPSPGRRHG